MSNILITANSSITSNNKLDAEILSFIKIIEDTGNTPVIFSEDTFMTEYLPLSPRFKYISAIPGNSDKLLFKRKHPMEESYLSSFSELRNPYKELKAKSLKRYPVRPKEKFYDTLEYESSRYSVMYNRIKYVMSFIAEDFPFIIVIKGPKQTQYVNIESKKNDGKFIYELNVQDFKSTLSMGGFPIPVSELKNCLKGVSND